MQFKKLIKLYDRSSILYGSVYKKTEQAI